MFTGIIEAVCKVRSFVLAPGGAKLCVDLGRDCPDVKYGDSISINGVCQTLVSLNSCQALFDVSGETLKKTTIGSLKAGSEVNVEYAMPASGRFGGHIVQGHVDGAAAVKSIKKQGDFWHVAFSADNDILDYVIPKGSIAIDGVSLTIAEVDRAGFAIAVIPATWNNTIFKNYSIGSKVNVETDILCRIVKTQLAKILPADSGLTANKLKQLGF